MNYLLYFLQRFVLLKEDKDGKFIFNLKSKMKEKINCDFCGNMLGEEVKIFYEIVLFL